MLFLVVVGVSVGWDVCSGVVTLVLWVLRRVLRFVHASGCAHMGNDGSVVV